MWLCINTVCPRSVTHSRCTYSNTLRIFVLHLTMIKRFWAKKMTRDTRQCSSPGLEERWDRNSLRTRLWGLLQAREDRSRRGRRDHNWWYLSCKYFLGQDWVSVTLRTRHSGLQTPSPWSSKRFSGLRRRPYFGQSGLSYGRVTSRRWLYLAYPKIHQSSKRSHNRAS